MATLEIKLKPFTVPNFVRSEGKNSNGELDGRCFALHELSDQTLENLCDEFRREVFEKANKIAPPTPPNKGS